MPRGKKSTKKTSATNPKKAAKVKNALSKEKVTKEFPLKQALFQQLKLSESYVSLILGAFVVLVLSVGFFIFLSGNNSLDKGNVLPAKDAATGIPSSVSISPSLIPSVAASPGEERKYILEEGESLWDVAVKFYGDGFRWVDLARVNNLEATSDYVPPGTTLIIP